MTDEEPRAHTHLLSATLAIVLTVLVIALQLWCALSYFAPGQGADWKLVTTAPRERRVVSVKPGSGAAAAGLRAGDVIVWQDVAQRNTSRFGVPHSQATVRESVVRGNRPLTIDLPMHDFPSPFARSPVPTSFNLLAIAVAIIAIAAAGLLIVREPGPMTWALWISMLGLSWLPTLRDVPAPVNAAVFVALATFFTNASLWALPLFALRFPGGGIDPGNRFAAGIFRALFVAAIGATAAFYAVDTFTFAFPPTSAGDFYRWSMISSAIPVFATIAIVTRRFDQARGEERARLRWAVLGVIVSSVSYGSAAVLYGILGQLATPESLIAAYLLSIPALALPFSVWYALRQSRLVDARVIVNRAAIYAMLTVLIVGAIALIDWSIGRMLSNTKLATVLEAAVTVALGFALNSLHSRLERAVEGFVFARRRAAEHYLHRLAATLPIAMSEGTIERAVTYEVCDGFGIASAAVFRRDTEGGAFVRAAATGWGEAMLGALHAEDALLRFVLTERSTVRVAEVRWKPGNVPSGIGAPVYAVPLAVRGEITGVVLYGGHVDRTVIEREELAIIVAFVDRAAAALDLVAASLLRRELAGYRALYPSSAAPALNP